MTTNYTFQTPESLYVLIQHPTLSESVNIHAAHSSDLETVKDNLELAGRAEGRFLDDLEIQEDQLTDVVDNHGNQATFFLELTKADLALFLQFEVLNFLGVLADA
jgi:hypothetical protein